MNVSSTTVLIMQLALGAMASVRQASKGTQEYTFQTDNSSVLPSPFDAFLLKLIAKLQWSGTMPTIHVDAHAAWLAE